VSRHSEAVRTGEGVTGLAQGYGGEARQNRCVADVPFFRNPRANTTRYAEKIEPQTI